MASLLTYCLLWFIAAQVRLGELTLLTGRYNFRCGRVQYVSWFIALSLTAAIIIQCSSLPSGSLAPTVTRCIIELAVFIFSEWVAARIRLQKKYSTLIYRLAVIVVLYSIDRLICSKYGQTSLPVIQAIICGIYFRNSPFGTIRGRDIDLIRFLMNDNVSHTGAGRCKSEVDGSSINVTDFGILPDSGTDVTSKLQSLIDTTGRNNGGGTLFFPRGKYIFDTSPQQSGFIRINHSNITLQGETDENGNPLSEFVCCNPTVRGDHNPWISPFLITTGEKLQPSNIFFGLDFNRKKQIRMESSSLSDPGSDGTMLTPQFVTEITADAEAGSTLIKVEDSSGIRQFVMLGLYNTTEDGNLIKDILGVEELREEWLLAHRAGPEEAPSFQWLVKVCKVIDRNTIELAEPLPRDCRLIYNPRLFDVPMLENIVIRDLKLSSRWNGLFRHHGFPLYYSVKQSQEMDYGWNAINLKRVSCGIVENVIIEDYTNPLYVMDSINCRISHLTICGYDGHQGIKTYCHSCHNSFSDIVFKSHFADMMGGEGNSYCNGFKDIRYENGYFKPVDFDFHGFSEGPMSPPAFNIFRNIYGFRYIKGAGAITHIPSCGTGNEWHDIHWVGGIKGDENVFIMLPYRKKRGILKYATAIGFTAVMALKTKRFSPGFIFRTFRDKCSRIDSMGLDRKDHAQFFPDNRIYS